MITMNNNWHLNAPAREHRQSRTNGWASMLHIVGILSFTLTVVSVGLAEAPLHEHTFALYPILAATQSSDLPSVLTKDLCIPYVPGTTSEGPAHSAPSISLSVDGAQISSLSDAVLNQFEKKLGARGKVLRPSAGQSPEQPAIVLIGCFIRIEPGNAAKAMAGMGLGASHLEAHFRVANFDGTTFTIATEFEAKVSGGTKLPPLGPIGIATHAAAETRETLSADAKKLANNALKAIKQLQSSRSS